MEVSNPSIEEVSVWAYSDSDWPHEEWDLFLSWTKEVDLFIDLATDHSCPKQDFFLHMLYYIVGITHEEPNKSEKDKSIEAYVEKGSGIKHGAIKKWRRDVQDLLRSRVKYNYDNWRGGIFAKYEVT